MRKLQQTSKCHRTYRGTMQHLPFVTRSPHLKPHFHRPPQNPVPPWSLGGPSQVKVESQCHLDDFGFHPLRTQAAQYHSWFKVGDQGTLGKVCRQSFLCLVWRTYRVLINHSMLDGRLGGVVEEPWVSGVGTIHGQGQHSFPHCHFPMHTARYWGKLHSGQLFVYYGIS